MSSSDKLEAVENTLTARTCLPKIKEQWKPLGVYRTFPFPISPPPLFVPRKKWIHPVTKKVY
jgi:hypothetical protein